MLGPRSLADPNQFRRGAPANARATVLWSSGHGFPLVRPDISKVIAYIDLEVRQAGGAFDRYVDSGLGSGRAFYLLFIISALKGLPGRIYRLAIGARSGVISGGAGLVTACSGGSFRVEPALSCPLASGVCGCRCRYRACRLRYRRRCSFVALAPAALSANDLRDRAAEHGEGIADPRAHLQGRVRARNLERGQNRPLRAAQDIPDLPLVGRAWSKNQAGRPPGAGRILHNHARPDESQFQLLSCDQHRFSQQLR